jgi:hypothetical protein
MKMILRSFGPLILHVRHPEEISAGVNRFAELAELGNYFDVCR